MNSLRIIHVLYKNGIVIVFNAEAPVEMEKQEEVIRFDPRLNNQTNSFLF